MPTQVQGLGLVDNQGNKSIVVNLSNARQMTNAEYQQLTAEQKNGAIIVTDYPIPEQSDYVEASVPSGQTWTWQTLLNDLFSKVDLNKIDSNSTLWEINDYWSMCHHLERRNDSNLFFSRELNTSDLSGCTFQLNASTSKKYDFNLSDGTPYDDNSLTNVSSGTVVRLYYNYYKNLDIHTEYLASKCLMSDGTNLQERVGKNEYTISNAVNLIANTPVSFTAPYDGYLTVYSTNSDTRVVIRAEVSGNSLNMGNAKAVSSSEWDYATLYMRKGMTVTVSASGSNGRYNFISF